MDEIIANYGIIFEPYKIKTVSPMKFCTRAERLQKLQDAGYNTMALMASDVLIDLFSDSGTAAITLEQSAATVRGDEGFTSSASWHALEETILKITGYQFALPIHHGRQGERLLYSQFLKPGSLVISNSCHHVTRQFLKDVAEDMVIELPQYPLGKSVYGTESFQGNLDITELQQMLADRRKKVGAVILTLTAIRLCTQPVSLENIRQVAAVCHSYHVPVVLDASRFVENAWFIQTREDNCTHKNISTIAREMFSYGDACIVSAENCFATTGGFIAIKNSRTLYETLQQLLYLTEGSKRPGMSGRDMSIFNLGLIDSMNDDMIRHKMNQLKILENHLSQLEVPVIRGCHIFIDAGSILQHIPEISYPALAFTNALYIEGGIRGMELGRVLHGDHYRGPDLVRLSLPARVYTDKHLEYVAEVIRKIVQKQHLLCGYKVVEERPLMRHINGKFMPLKPVDCNS